ncbi:MAG: YbaK/EbsC family protein [Gammaproteobacteria bacterium]|nr:YbaK/EbsC family protein [Gammaproteobacteria bacterium]
MPSKILKDFLDDNEIKYVSIMHSLAFTAVEIAKSAHIPSKEMAKTVIIKHDSELAMAVVPANYKLKLNLLQQALDNNKVELATEQEFTSRFPDCEVGAMPPFGNLYNMDVYVAESLTEDARISFNAGSHSEVIQMDYKDYERMVKPRFIMLSN